MAWLFFFISCFHALFFWLSVHNFYYNLWDLLDHPRWCFIASFLRWIIFSWSRSLLCYIGTIIPLQFELQNHLFEEFELRSMIFYLIVFPFSHFGFSHLEGGLVQTLGYIWFNLHQILWFLIWLWIPFLTVQSWYNWYLYVLCKFLSPVSHTFIYVIHIFNIFIHYVMLNILSADSLHFPICI